MHMSLTALARPPIPAKANHHTGFAQRVSLSSQPNPTFLTSVCPLRARPDIFVHEDRQLLMGPPDSPPPLDAHFHLQSGLSAFGVSPATELTLFSLQNHGSRRTHSAFGRIIDTTLTLRLIGPALLDPRAVHFCLLPRAPAPDVSCSLPA